MAGMLAAGFPLFWSNTHPDRINSSEQIAVRVEFISHEAKKRPAQTLVWEQLWVGDCAQHGDAVFVPPGSHAVFRFPDGSRLDVEQNSLFVLDTSSLQQEPSQSIYQLNLKKGYLFTRAGNHGLKITSKDMSSSLSPKSLSRFEVDQHQGSLLSVMQGSVSAQTQSGKSHSLTSQNILMSHAGRAKQLNAYPVILEHPEQNQIYFLHPHPKAIHLTWRDPQKKASRLLIAKDRRFENRIQDTDIQTSNHSFTPKQPGTYYWRLVNQEKNPASDIGVFLISSCRTPVGKNPLQGEHLLAGHGKPITFEWTRMKESSEYIIELSRDKEFNQIVTKLKTKLPNITIGKDLNEGHYYWRVGSVHAELGVCGFSKPIQFRLIRSVVPDAPKDLESEYE